MVTKETRDKIRAEALSGTSHRALAKKYGVGLGSISRIRNEALNNQTNSKRGFRPDDPMVRSDAIKYAQKHKNGFTREELAVKLYTTPENAERVLEYLCHHDKYNLVPKGNLWLLLRELTPAPVVNLDRLKGKEYSFGVIADPHLCCKDARQDVCEAAFEEFARRKIADVFVPGNLIHGEWYKIHHELEVFGCHNQCQYFADYWPQRKGITTRFITAECHEGWFQDKGLIIGQYLENVCANAGRNDITFIGHIEQDILIKQKYGSTRIRLMHPGGGTAYALSYPSQKMVESFQGGEKPHILILGHYHKYDNCYPREVVTIMAGTACDQTRYMRLHKLAAHVGFLIVKIGSRIDGTIGRCNVEWFPFYDRKYHTRLDEYELILE